MGSVALLHPVFFFVRILKFSFIVSWKGSMFSKDPNLKLLIE